MSEKKPLVFQGKHYNNMGDVIEFLRNPRKSDRQILGFIAAYALQFPEIRDKIEDNLTFCLGYSDQPKAARRLARLLGEIKGD